MERGSMYVFFCREQLSGGDQLSQGSCRWCFQLFYSRAEVYLAVGYTTIHTNIPPDTFIFFRIQQHVRIYKIARKKTRKNFLHCMFLLCVWLGISSFWLVGGVKRRRNLRCVSISLDFFC